ncbi:MAG: AAA family ATPase [Candidatus Neoclostridium sp.]
MSRIITIGREFGSGGRELGRRFAEELGIEYYDKEILTEIARHTSLSEQYVSQILEKQPHALYPIAIGHSFTSFSEYYVGSIQSVYRAQSEIINSLADKSDCVIIGRCADYILREKKPYRIFVYADMQSRVARCKQRSPESESLSDKQIEKQIKTIDKDRAKFYCYFTGNKWGARENYDICINTTNTDIKQLVANLAKMFK